MVLPDTEIVQSLVTQWASNRRNNRGMPGERPKREKRGIEMKSKGLK